MSDGSFITTFVAAWNVCELFGCGQRLLCAFSRQALLVPVEWPLSAATCCEPPKSTCAMPVAPVARANVGSSAVGGVASMVIVAAGALTWLARVAASLADRRRSSQKVWVGVTDIGSPGSK